MMFFKRMNIGNIIVNHFKTFYNNKNNEKKIDAWELFVYFLILLTISVLSAVYLPITRLSIILTPLTIFTGFLFSALFVIIDKKEAKTQQQQDLIVEVYDNISFSILMSFIAILFIVINYVIINFSFPTYYSRGLLSVIYFVLLNFSYSLMMVIKRLYKIFEN